MRSFLTLFLFCATLLMGGVSEATYDVSFGLFDRLGQAKATYRTDGATYTITIGAKATGMAAFLSGQREDTYESVGKIVEGRLRPDRYVTLSHTSSKTTRSTYLFDHTSRKIRHLKEELKGGHFTLKDDEVIDYYTGDDILSLYFNLMPHLGTLKAGVKNGFIAVGANKSNGRVDVILATGEDRQELIDELGGGAGDRYLRVIINQKIFSSANGELALRVSKENICTKAILSDVLFFGDIRGEIVR